MGYYVTKKRVKEFVHFKQLTKRDLIELNLCLVDLKEFPEDNKNQIRFFEKVKKYLQDKN